MSDQAESSIPAGAQLWDEVLGLRQEQRQFREDFQGEWVRVRNRHVLQAAQLTQVIAAGESNTQAREYFEDEIKQLHTVMKQWYHTIIDLQKQVLLITEMLDADRMGTMGPPLPLLGREHAA